MDGRRARTQEVLPIETRSTNEPATQGSVGHLGGSRPRRLTPRVNPSPRPTRAEADNGFRGPQVCSIIGITYRQLDYWARTDLLRPSLSDARGSGSQRLYSYTDLVQLKVIKQLIEAGVSLRATRKAIECLRSSGADLASARLVIADDKTVLAHTGEELFDLLHGGQGVLSIVLGLDKLVSEVDAAITDMRRSPAGETGQSVGSVQGYEDSETPGMAARS
jgi:DNA-binding transcriptional MerR regulator